MTDISSRGKKFIATHDGKVRFEQQNNRILQSDGTDDRLVIGTRPDSSIGPFLSQPGFDVKSANNDELIINSGQNVFKIAEVGTFSTSASYTDTTINVSSASFGTTNHTVANTGHTPAVLLYTVNPSTPTLYYPADHGAVIQTGFWSLAANYVITRQIFIQPALISVYYVITYQSFATNGLGTKTVNEDFKYYVLQEAAS